MKKLLSKLFDKVILAKSNIREYANKIIVISIGMVLFVPKLAYATPNPGQAASTWFLEQAFPLAIAVTVGICVMFVLKKNAIRMVTTLFVGGFVCAIIKQPTLIQTFGTYVLQITGLSS